ncbi:hypothetical protein PFFCH_05301, partial [Plasmodium falciparum FCH/4]
VRFRSLPLEEKYADKKRLGVMRKKFTDVKDNKNALVTLKEEKDVPLLLERNGTVYEGYVLRVNKFGDSKSFSRKKSICIKNLCKKLNEKDLYEIMKDSEAEEILNRIKNHKGVIGILVVNSEGLIIKSTFDQQQSDLHASLLTQLSKKARDVIRELDPQNDINFLRLRSKKHEIMIAPDKDYTLIVVQDPYADKEKS